MTRLQKSFFGACLGALLLSFALRPPIEDGSTLPLIVTGPPLLICLFAGGPDAFLSATHLCIAAAAYYSMFFAPLLIWNNDKQVAILWAVFAFLGHGSLLALFFLTVPTSH